MDSKIDSITKFPIITKEVGIQTIPILPNL